MDLWFCRFRDFLKEEADLNGKLIVRELIFRFAMVQFQGSRGFVPGKIEFIVKVFEEMQAELGAMFEEFASFCFSKGFDEAFVNAEMERWLRKISEEMELEKAD